MLYILCGLILLGGTFLMKFIEEDEQSREIDERQMNYAEGRFQSKEYEKALEAYGGFLKRHPKDARAYRQRGQVYLEMEQFDRAVSDFTEAIRLRPGDANTLVYRALARSKLGLDEAAIADCNEAIRVNPNLANAYIERGYAHLNQKECDAAIADCDQAQRLDSDKVSIYFLRGAAYEAKNEFAMAIADYREAIQRQPDYELALQYAARCLATCPDALFRDGDEAVRYAKKACELTKWKDPEVLSVLAAACAETGDFEAAIKWQKETLEFPEFAKRYDEDIRARLELYMSRQHYRKN